MTLNGKPLACGSVVFAPDMGRAATGAIQPDGSYVLSTYGTADGAIVGKHRVAVVAREELPGSPLTGNRAGRWLIPELYGESGKSGLRYDVQAGRTNVFDIQLSSNGPSDAQTP